MNSYKSVVRIQRGLWFRLSHCSTCMLSKRVELFTVDPITRILSHRTAFRLVLASRCAT